MIDFTFLADLSGNLETLFSLPLGSEFGFNTNVLETNVINLAVVVGIVVTFGGNNLRSLLENRRQTILNNLQEADQRAVEAQQKLEKAKSQLEQAQLKAVEIKKQGSVTVESDKEQSVRETQSQIKRLEENKIETLKLQQQKAINQVSQQVISRAVNKVRSKLSRLNEPFHISLNYSKIERFVKYKV